MGRAHALMSKKHTEGHALTYLKYARTYRPQGGRGHVTGTLAKFKPRLKIVQISVCTMVPRQQLLL